MTYPMSLQPPEDRLDDLIRAGDERQEREERQFAYLAETLAGKGGFWKDENEESGAMFKVLQATVRIPGITDAQRWRLIHTALYGLAEEWANWRSGEPTL